MLVLLTACSPSKNPEPLPLPKAPAPAATNAPIAAQALFDRTTKEFHLPSAEASGARQKELLSQAAAGYEQLLREHPKQTNLCAQALRSLANIRATEGHLGDAIALHASVAKRYPAEEWEILQSWKSAGDLLTDAQRAPEAAPFYRQIIERFDRTNAAPVVQIIVRSARKRLTSPRRPGARAAHPQRSRRERARLGRSGPERAEPLECSEAPRACARRCGRGRPHSTRAPERGVHAAETSV